MDHIGIDVQKKDSQICTLAEGGELIEQRIRTEPERFAAVLGEGPRARTVPVSRRFDGCVSANVALAAVAGPPRRWRPHPSNPLVRRRAQSLAPDERE